MEKWKTMRATWQQVRDKQFKVPKGAVKGVSVGDAIDAVYKKSSGGLAPTLAAASALSKKLDAYCAGLDKKYAPLASWVKSNLKAEAAGLIARIGQDQATLKALDAGQSTIPGPALLARLPIELGAKTDWATKKASGELGSLGAFAQALDAYAAVLDAADFKVTLPGRAADYAALKKAGGTYRTVASTLRAATQAGSEAALAQFLRQNKAVGEAWMMATMDFGKAVKSIGG